MPTVDRNTGQTANGTNPNAYNYTKTDVKGPENTMTSGTQNTTGTSYVSSYSDSFILNTTPEARDALNNLIATLSDRPVVSAEEAAAKFPQARRVYSRDGWYWVDPRTGQSMSDVDAAAFNEQQLAKQKELITSSGIIRGGTEDQRQLHEERMTEIQRDRATQDKYSKEAAFADTKALTNYFTRVLSEEQMPGILRSAEGAGASQGSMRALLTQQAIARNTETAARVGIDAATKYGAINADLAKTLEELTKEDPNGITAQLLQALNIAKGIQTAGTTSGGQTTTQNTKTNTTGTSDKSGSTDVQIINPNDKFDPSIKTNVDIKEPAYTPSSGAGSGYIIADPVVTAVNSDYGDVNFTNYGSGDENLFTGTEGE